MQHPVGAGTLLVSTQQQMSLRSTSGKTATRHEVTPKTSQEHCSAHPAGAASCQAACKQASNRHDGTPPAPLLCRGGSGGGGGEDSPTSAEVEAAMAEHRELLAQNAALDAELAGLEDRAEASVVHMAQLRRVLTQLEKHKVRDGQS